MIAVLGWYDGFGNDTYLLGIFSNVDKAKEILGEDIKRYKYQEVDLNEIGDYDYYEAKEFI